MKKLPSARIGVATQAIVENRSFLRIAPVTLATVFALSGVGDVLGAIAVNGAELYATVTFITVGVVNFALAGTCLGPELFRLARAVARVRAV